MRWWEKVLLVPSVVLIFGCCGIIFWTAAFTESSLDPLDTDVVYWNDTETTVIVWECGRDCSDLGKHYTLKPDDMKLYSESRHPRPAAILVKGLDGSVLGCTGVDLNYGRASLYYRVSVIDDCSFITPAPTR
jgi:hypothetical protein